tara:strand:- start:30233 stop:32005 length:1773 start_codon:yes stop_codon:yes gene_type:complete
MSVAVLWTAEDARRLLLDAPKVSSAIGLTPVSRIKELDTFVKVINNQDNFNNIKQAYLIEKVETVREKLIKQFENCPEFSPGVREIVLDHYNRVAFSSLRLWESLGEVGPWIIRIDSDWKTFNTRKAAFHALIDQGLVNKIDSEKSAAKLREPFFISFFCWLQRITLGKILCKKTNVLSNALKEKSGLLPAISETSPELTIVIAQPSRSLLKPYAILFRDIARSFMCKSPIQYTLTPQFSSPQNDFVKKIISAVEDPVIKPAFDCYQDLMVYRIMILQALESEANNLCRNIPFKAFIAAELSNVLGWLLSQATKDASIPRIVLSRNAHAPAVDKLGLMAVRDYFRARYPKNMVDTYLMWSPLGLAAAKQVLPETEHSAIKNVRVLSNQVKKNYKKNLNRDRFILFADSFVTWWYPHNWIYQNSDEFIQCLIDFCDAIKQVDKVEALVRVKHKHECDLPAINQLVNPPKNVKINIRDGSFAKDVERADLVISFRSTTIEESIHARTPVLLWGASMRHPYLDVQNIKPNISKRSAIYMSNRKENLAEMISSILDAHAGRPLIDEEIEPYVFSEDIRDLNYLAHSISGGRGII